MKTESNTCGKSSGIDFDDRLSFDYYISELCKKTCQKTNAIARVSQCINISERKVLKDLFFVSLIESSNIAHWYECSIVALIIGKFTRSAKDAKDYLERFKKLLKRDRSISIHGRNIQMLATEMYNSRNAGKYESEKLWIRTLFTQCIVNNNFSIPHMNEIFDMKIPIDKLRQILIFLALTKISGSWKWKFFLFRL